MKLGNTGLILVILIVVAALITEPGQKDFEKYLKKKGVSVFPPAIRRTNSFGFSLYDVQYYALRKPLTQDDSAPLSAGPLIKERYLGLFGNFWKL